MMPVMPHHMRIARPVSSIERTKEMYCRGLGLRVIGSFDDHDGFDGVMLGAAGAGYHFEFTYCHAHPVRPLPTVEDLVVLYVASEREWHEACASMLAAGFERAIAFNPYWDAAGRTFVDRDGYRIVLQKGDWNQTGRGDQKSGPRDKARRVSSVTRTITKKRTDAGS